MSRRLLQRGRYPKDASLYQSSNAGKQEPATSGLPLNATYSPASDVQMYNTQLTPQTNQSSESMWQQQQPYLQQYEGQISPYQNEQLPQQSWHNESPYYPNKPQGNDAWNWMPENSSSNTSSNNIQRTLQPQYQPLGIPQSPYLQQSPSSSHQSPQFLQDQQQLTPNPANVGLHQSQQFLQDLQQLTQNPANMSSHQSQQFLQDLQQLTPNPANVSSHESQQLAPNPAANVSYMVQNECFPENSCIPNQNGNQCLPDFQQQLQSWETVPQNIPVQSQQLPWTYQVPQTILPQNDQTTAEWPTVNISSNSVYNPAVSQSWNVSGVSDIKQESVKENSFNTQQENAYLSPQPLDHRQINNSVPNIVSQCDVENSSNSNLYVYSDHNIENLEACSTTGSASIAPSSSRDSSFEQEHESRNLSAFFQHSAEEAVTPDPVQLSSLSDNYFVNHRDSITQPSVVASELPKEVSQIHNEENVYIDASRDVICGNAMQDRDIVPCESAASSESLGFTPDLCSEEPPNMEVPEPNDPPCKPSVHLHSAEQLHGEDEPQNQQVPAEADVVQPKSDSLSQHVPQSNHKSFVQGVNLETVPDNLERPPDHDELKKYSSWHSHHHQQLRNQNENALNLSSASLLNNPQIDIPLITLAPAAPLLIVAVAESVVPESEIPAAKNQMSETFSGLNSSDVAEDSNVSVGVAQEPSASFSVRTDPTTNISNIPNLQPASNPSSAQSQKTIDNVSSQENIVQKESINEGNKNLKSNCPDQSSEQPVVSGQNRYDTENYLQESSEHCDKDLCGRYPQNNSEQYPPRISEHYDKQDSEYYHKQLPERYSQDTSEQYQRHSPEKLHQQESDRYRKGSPERYPQSNPEQYQQLSPEKLYQRSLNHYPKESPDRYAKHNSEQYPGPEQRNYRHYEFEQPRPRDSEHSSEHDSRSDKDFRYYRDDRDRPYTADPDHRTPDNQSARDRNHEIYNRSNNFDGRNYSDREGSRPPSRMSLNESTEHHMYRHYQKPYASDNERPSSRMSESGAYRRDDRSRPLHDGQYNRSSRDEYFQGAQGYGGYDYDPYQMSRHPYYGYYDPYKYNYSRYNYGYYDELYRNDPRYRQQMEEQYREYYRRMGYDTDYERSSVHSGRSSATELSKEVAQRYPDTPSEQQYSEQSYAYPDGPSQFSSFDVSGDRHSTPAARLTPAKYTSAHTFANFCANGMLISLIPRQKGSGTASLIEIHDVQALTQNLESSEDLKSFRGPLIRGETHKNDIIEFCLQKVKLYKRKEGIPDRESYVLLWELLVLMLRQNGSVAGSDIAELLLKDHEILHPSPFKPIADPTHADNSPTDAGEPSSHVQTGDASSPDEGIVVTREKTLLNAAHNADADKVTRKFREFLLFGHKKDALEWAMKHALWGHALFLASKMDLRTYANVMTRFANSLALNDPLQTLYQLMSGRQPAAVTCIADKQWGDWRPHLAMILSNPSPHAEVDSKSITTLGDTLASQGCLAAAHFCYLMAQVDFGSYSQKNSKLVLLCADNQLPFDEFATNEVIQCTEIYEYAQSLANPGFVLNHLQAYKFIYAARLLDHGFIEEALHYCEVLAANFLSSPGVFSIELITQVYELASKIKYFDPHYLQGQGELEDQDDPEWLSRLFAYLSNPQQECLDSPATTTNEETPYVFPSTETYTQEVAEATPQIPSSSTANYYTSENQQTYYYNNNSNLPWTANSTTFQEQPQQVQQFPQDMGHYSDTAVSTPPTSSQYQNVHPSNQWSAPNTPKAQESFQETPSGQTISELNSPVNTTPLGQSFRRFDFYGTTEPQQGQSVKTSNRERTSSTSSIGFQRDRRDSIISSGSDYAGASSASTSRKASESQKADEKLEKQRSQVGRSWLGGIFSRLLPKGPNQMILPDDKNPTIVWDPTSKRWVNMDSNEEDESIQPAAPPTDTELMSKSPPDSLHMPSMPPVAATSTPVANKFQRQKVKGMRQNYVDVLNNGISTTKLPTPADALFPSLPTMQQLPANVFIPSAPVSEDMPVDFVSSGQPVLSSQGISEENPSVTKAPPMFDPAEFDSRRSSISSIRHSVGPARRTYPT